MATEKNNNRPSMWHIIKTTFAAALGVQSNKNREIDFAENSSPLPYIIAGIIFTAVFMGTIIFVVSLIV